MIKEGALEKPRPLAIFGLHTTPETEAGRIGYRAGPAQATTHGRARPAKATAHAETASLVAPLGKGSFRQPLRRVAMSTGEASKVVMRTAGPMGRQTVGDVGPNKTTLRAPHRPARWLTPESLPR